MSIRTTRPHWALAWIMIIGVLLTPALPAHAASTGGWQLYTVADGLVESPTFRVAPDGRGGLWAGHMAGGRGIGRRGGFVHLPEGGDGVVVTDAPFDVCTSVDALSLAPDGYLWFKLSGIHDYGSSDYQGLCSAAHGAAIGRIDSNGTITMVPKAQLPAGTTAGLAVDARGRVWVGTEQGASVRETNGAWTSYPIHPAGGAARTSTLKASPDGRRIALGSSIGDLALVDAGGATLSAPTLVTTGTDRSRPVFDLAWTPSGLAATIGGTLVYQDRAGTWQQNPLPPGADQINGVHVAYLDTFYIGVPNVASGLYRLGAQGWEPIRPGATPLQSGVINDLELESPTSMLIATDQGVARLTTGSFPADPARARAAFERLWSATNRGVGGSWVWGPFAWAERYEAYREGPGGVRYVRYFDKARMELPQPDADPNAPWYVTNGLLVVELVRGQAQLGDDPTRAICPVGKGTLPCPSPYPVAGDANPNTNRLTPSYGEMATLLIPAARRSGALVGTTYLQADDMTPFALGEQPSLATEATRLTYFDDITGHNVPAAFWDYLNRQPTDWLFAFGRPIAEPVWVQTQIGGVRQWTMVQLFERRTLTYTPANAPAWQVEMGNVGQHAYAWRYGADPNTPPWTTPLVSRGQ